MWLVATIPESAAPALPIRNHAPPLCTRMSFGVKSETQILTQSFANVSPTAPGSLLLQLLPLETYYETMFGK